jgi:hypothetical protein
MTAGEGRGTETMRRARRTVKPIAAVAMWFFETEK